MKRHLRERAVKLDLTLLQITIIFVNHRKSPKCVLRETGNDVSRYNKHLKPIKNYRNILIYIFCLIQGWANFLTRGPHSEDNFDRGPHWYLKRE